jgi:molybdate transport system substrate-binding protein
MRSAVLAAAALLAACGLPAPRPRALIVFAAASLTDAFVELGQRFEADRPGLTVTFNFAGSQALRTQLEQGAVADVFASADLVEMDRLVTAGLAAAAAPRVFLTNRLLVVLPASNPAGIQTLEDLSRTGIKLVLAAEEVPAGRYARQVLENLNALYGAGYMEAVVANVVSNEDNIRQVLTKVQLGEADAGMVYASDAAAAPDLTTLPIPDEYSVIARYPIAPLASAPEPELAAAFVDYVLSAEGQAVLQKWGFTSARP